MDARRGRVLHILGWIIGVPLGVAAWVAFFNTVPPERFFLLGFFKALAVLSIGLGLVCRYVLAGR
jgi:hypothetical protein